MDFRSFSPLLLAFLLTPGALAEVVHTTNGESVIGTIVSTGATGPLVVETLSHRVEIPRQDVLTIEEREELLKALNAAKRRLHRNDWNGTMCLSDWALRKGLFSNALELADAALLAAAKSDDPPAVELSHDLFRIPVAGIDSRKGLDEAAAWTLLLQTAMDRPATALVATTHLKTGARLEGVTAALLRGLKHRTPEVRCTALKVLAVSVPEGTIERVIERMLFDRDRKVRNTATETVKAYANDGVVYPLVRAVQQNDAQLRLAALDAIEMLRERRAVGTLIRHLRRGSGGSGVVRNSMSVTTQTSFVQDFDVEIAQAAVIADPVIGVVQDGTVFDVGVAGVFERRVPPAERARVGRLLGYLTGQNFGTDVHRWEEWWARQGQ